MKPDGPNWATAAATWSEWTLDGRQLEGLEAYAGWLRREALPAGLMGPHEVDRIWRRHIADSLLFSVGWDHAPAALVDLGTGAGLPGVPLAVLWPDCQVTLVERSTRRGDLLRRLEGVLGLGNFEVMTAEADQWQQSAAIVMRAVLPPPDAIRLCGDLLLPNGRAVLGWSERVALDKARTWHPGPDLDYAERTVPSRVLDDTRSLLIMTRRG